MTNLSQIEQFLGSPICKWLGASVTQDDEGPLYQLTFHERHIGNPAIRAIHGGVVAGFLEIAAKGALIAFTEAPGPFDAVNMDIDYLLSTRPENMYARAKVVRKGRRVAFIDAWCWQQDVSRPVAQARFRIRPLLSGSETVDT